MKISTNLIKSSRFRVCSTIFRKYTTKNDGNTYVSTCGIQMLPRSLHKQIFTNNTSTEVIREDVKEKVKNHLSTHDLWGKKLPLLPDVHIDLPKLKGNNITEHFKIIAEEQTEKYKKLMIDFISSETPVPPEEWVLAPGWTKYSSNGKYEAVDYPDERVYVFDIEVCVKDGHYPTLATALSKNNWYSWCSNRLFATKVCFFNFS